MTTTMKKTLDMMKYLNPYRNLDNEETYLQLWHSLKTLKNLGILTNLEWSKIYDLDNKMFNNSFNHLNAE